MRAFFSMKKKTKNWIKIQFKVKKNCDLLSRFWFLAHSFQHKMIFVLAMMPITINKVSGTSTLSGHNMFVFFQNSAGVIELLHRDCARLAWNAAQHGFGICCDCIRSYSHASIRILGMFGGICVRIQWDITFCGLRCSALWLDPLAHVTNFKKLLKTQNQTYGELDKINKSKKSTSVVDWVKYQIYSRIQGVGNVPAVAIEWRFSRQAHQPVACRFVFSVWAGCRSNIEK